jgi:hypothetical protein
MTATPGARQQTGESFQQQSSPSCTSMCNGLLASPGSHLRRVDTADCCIWCLERCVALQQTCSDASPAGRYNSDGLCCVQACAPADTESEGLDRGGGSSGAPGNQQGGQGDCLIRLPVHPPSLMFDGKACSYRVMHHGNCCKNLRRTLNHVHTSPKLCTGVFKYLNKKKQP